MRSITATLLGVALLVAGCGAIPRPRASSFHPSDADLSVTRIVHGAAIVELRATRLLVDPWFHSGFLTRQAEPLGIVPEGLPPLAAVLVTHRHPEHFDRRALAELAKTVAIAIGPPDLAATLAELGFRDVRSLGYWDHTTVNDVEITAVPASHAVHENGYVLSAHGLHAYLAGDTRYFSGLVDIATAWPRLDVALLPVGGRRVVGFLREMNAAEAARATALLRPAYVVPMAYGAHGLPPLWWHASDPVAAFVDACRAEGLPAGRIVPLAPGESWHYLRPAR
ncbi:MAG: MBL fold metallo-hydrolase [Candidatus Binatia bacterium]